MNNPVNRAPTSYYGGKISLLHHILPMIPPHEVYTEAFIGGGAVFWNKEKAKNETINDLNDFVVNFYEQIKVNFKALNELIDRSLVARKQHSLATAIYRDPDAYPEVKRAWAFWYLANFSFANKFGGGLKYSNAMSTVVPDVMLNKKAKFTEWLVDRIEHTTIENKPGLWILESRNVKNAFHFIDTPYHNADMGHYNNMKWTEERLVEVLEWCQTCKGRFMLTNYNSEPLEAYIKQNGWYKKEITVRLKARVMKNDTRYDKTEVVVTNYSQTCLIENKLFNE